MINGFTIQVEHPVDGWRDVTNVPIGFNRATAFKAAMREFNGWSDYAGFLGRKLRIVEERIGQPGYVEARL